MLEPWHSIVEKGAQFEGHPPGGKVNKAQRHRIGLEGLQQGDELTFRLGARNLIAEDARQARSCNCRLDDSLRRIGRKAPTDRKRPDAWVFDQALLDRTGNDRIQVELLYQYQHNVALYPQWQDFLKKAQFPTLVVWGDGDPIFTTKGRDLFRALVPSAEVHSWDAGHFALETHAPEIAQAMVAFLDRLSAKR